ncbi:HEAT repeat domain-containing protein [Methanococcoides orientis]|uniref:HEAT repeat domain-containing protein n=1 Tax=Methanococcoides orientis TaxID=2822137 RepID=UPI001E5C9230|nr:HEAT repeat domain-containing protein [Methanococcoides orientis]UGV41200.1 HEAT repeat domain-containing protein [Methanococcoides orientis]
MQGNKKSVVAILITLLLVVLVIGVFIYPGVRMDAEVPEVPVNNLSVFQAKVPSSILHVDFVNSTEDFNSSATDVCFFIINDSIGNTKFNADSFHPIGEAKIENSKEYLIRQVKAGNFVTDRGDYPMSSLGRVRITEVEFVYFDRFADYPYDYRGETTYYPTWKLTTETSNYGHEILMVKAISPDTSISYTDVYDSITVAGSLISDMADENISVRVNAVKELVEMDKSAVEPLIRALESYNPKIRENSARALGKIGNETAVEPLIHALGDRDSEVRNAAKFGLMDIGDSAFEPLVRVANDLNESHASRVWAVQTLGEMGEPAVEPLIFLLADETGLDSTAAHSLSIIGEPAVEPLILALDDNDLKVRNHAAVALGRIGDEIAVEPLTKALNDESELVRTSAKISIEGIVNKHKYGAIATYGNVPEFYIGDERDLWIDELAIIEKEVSDDMLAYTYPNGSVVTYGPDINGFIVVDILDDSQVSTSLMDEIYGIFDQQSRQFGINEVPVVFQFQTNEPENG